jgi:hypothetical protein
MNLAGRVERHLAASLGRPALVTDASDPSSGRPAAFRVATFDDQPVESAFTLVTLGLCERALRDDEHTVRQELVVCAWNAFRDDALRHLLFALGDFIAGSGDAAAPGMVYELPEPFVSGRQWEHLFAFQPLYHDQRLGPFEDVQFVWLIPITAEESAFIDANGPESFDALLEEHDPDLLDLSRDSVVPGH